uniref:Uncharacterized protein n=1 Tax=Rhizophora mucronata TaxID=61149 RepID=A0A2P2QE33_RHIMU
MIYNDQIPKRLNCPKLLCHPQIYCEH